MPEQAEKLADKMRTASFTFEDFLDQFQQLRWMGSLDQVVAMCRAPGPSSAMSRFRDRAWDGSKRSSDL